MTTISRRTLNLTCTTKRGRPAKGEHGDRGCLDGVVCRLRVVCWWQSKFRLTRRFGGISSSWSSLLAFESSVREGRGQQYKYRRAGILNGPAILVVAINARMGSIAYHMNTLRLPPPENVSAKSVTRLAWTVSKRVLHAAPSSCCDIRSIYRPRITPVCQNHQHVALARPWHDYSRKIRRLCRCISLHTPHHTRT